MASPVASHTSTFGILLSKVNHKELKEKETQNSLSLLCALCGKKKFNKEQNVEGCDAGKVSLKNKSWVQKIINLKS